MADDSKVPALAVFLDKGKKGKPPADDGGGDDAAPDDAKIQATQELMDALKGGDPEEVYGAFEALVSICGGS